MKTILIIALALIFIGAVLFGRKVIKTLCELEDEIKDRWTSND